MSSTFKDFTSHDDSDDVDNSNIGGINLGGLVGSSGVASNNSADDEVEDVLINYNEAFKNADPIEFRDGVISQVMGILIGMSKPNALLVGAAGTGKSAIAEDIARRIANDDPSIPDPLKGYTIYELPLASLVAGKGIVGQLEEATKQVVDYVKDPKHKAILFIDEIHMLMSDGQIYGKIAQILKPALARGDFRVIGATTLQEANDINRDPAFNRRFSRVIVDELTSEQTLEILKKRRNKLMSHYNYKVSVDDDVLKSCVDTANRWSQVGSHRPDNALTLLDRSMGDALVEQKNKEAAVRNDPNMLAALQSITTIPLTEKLLKRCAMKLMTGHARKTNIDEASLANSLSHIMGQDGAISQITTMLLKRDLELFPTNKPMTVLLTGPSGVGKTAVSKAIAEELTECEPIMLNMTEYNDPATVNRIIGSPAGYVGSDSHAELPFDILESNPYQVIVLDEFEKCHPSVQRLFMSVFDEGKLQCSNGKVQDFSKAIIFATTNAGKTIGAKASLGFTHNEDKQAEEVSTLSQWFDVEFLNRFAAIIDFNAIEKDTYASIVANKYQTLRATLGNDRRLAHLPDIIPDDALEEIVATTYVRDFGARPAERAVKSYIEEEAIKAMHHQVAYITQNVDGTTQVES